MESSARPVGVVLIKRDKQAFASEGSAGWRRALVETRKSKLH